MVMKTLMLVLALLVGGSATHAGEVKYYDVPKGAHPHDVAADPKADGPVWYTAQHQGALGRLDPSTGKVEHIPLGEGSRPHGAIGPDDHAMRTRAFAERNVFDLAGARIEHIPLGEGSRPHGV